jgi:hypothetical protein
MARKKAKCTELSVFKGREARLNRAIFYTLGVNGPLTIYNLHRNLRGLKGFKHTHYANVNKRVRSLAKAAYVKAIEIRSTKAGFEAVIYELTAKTCLALMLDSLNVEQLFQQMDDSIAIEILAALSKAKLRI